MSTYAAARYAIWNHDSQRLQGTLSWRVTPKSKNIVGMVPSQHLHGLATVVKASSSALTLTIDDQQAAAIAKWLSNLPSDVMRSTAETEHCIVHHGPYLRLDSLYQVTSCVPQPGERVAVRLSAAVNNIGTLKKAHVIVTDICFADVATL